MNQFEFGWVCGILEGEACFSFTTYLRKRIRKGRVSHSQDSVFLIRVAQVDKTIVDKLQTLTGIGKVKPKKNYSPLSKKPQFEWRVSRRGELRFFLACIMPHMSERRQQRISQMLKFLTL